MFLQVPIVFERLVFLMGDEKTGVEIDGWDAQKKTEWKTNKKRV